MPKTTKRRSAPRLKFLEGKYSPPIANLRFGGVRLVPYARVHLSVIDPPFEETDRQGRQARLEAVFYLDPLREGVSGKDCHSIAFEKMFDLTLLPDRRFSTKEIFAVKEAMVVPMDQLAMVMTDAVVASCAKVSIELPGWPKCKNPETFTPSELKKLQVHITVSFRGYHDEYFVEWSAVSKFLYFTASEDE